MQVKTLLYIIHNIYKYGLRRSKTLKKNFLGWSYRQYLIDLSYADNNEGWSTAYDLRNDAVVFNSLQRI